MTTKDGIPIPDGVEPSEIAPLLERKTTMSGQGFAFRCGECDGGEVLWSILRVGDAVVSWACNQHFSEVALDLQRDHEVTELIVTYRPKALEWAEITKTLDDVAKGES